MRNQYTGEWDEMDRGFRETGAPPTRKRLRTDEATVRAFGSSDRIYPYINIPMCFSGARDEFEDFQVPQETVLERGGYPPAMVLEILQKERECHEFTPKRLGLTPKDHAEMLDRQRFIEWQEEQRKEQQAREDARDAAMRKREDDRDLAAKGRHRDSMWILGLLIALSTLVAAIVTAVAQHEGDVLINNGIPTAIVTPSPTLIPSTATPEPTAAPS